MRDGSPYLCDSFSCKNHCWVPSPFGRQVTPIASESRNFTKRNREIIVMRKQTEKNKLEPLVGQYNPIMQKPGLRNILEEECFWTYVWFIKISKNATKEQDAGNPGFLQPQQHVGLGPLAKLQPLLQVSSWLSTRRGQFRGRQQALAIFFNIKTVSCMKTY